MYTFFGLILSKISQWNRFLITEIIFILFTLKISSWRWFEFVKYSTYLLYDNCRKTGYQRRNQLNLKNKNVMTQIKSRNHCLMFAMNILRYMTCYLLLNCYRLLRTFHDFHHYDRRHNRETMDIFPLRFIEMDIFKNSILQDILDKNFDWSWC